MHLIRAFVIAMSMYSKIPMPRTEWSKEDMRYAMCFFPIVGILIGVTVYLVGKWLFLLSVGPVFRGTVFTLVPILVSGGIHMDGFLDTVDALASWGTPEKRLEILKDSHTGAFAVLGLGCYLMWSVAVWSELPEKLMAVSCLVFTVSRALSGLSVATFPAARDGGLLKTFQDGARKRAVGITMACFLLASSILALALDRKGAAGMALAALGTFVFYKRMCRKQFGGVTGDLAGYFLQVSELAMLTGILVFGGGLWN